MMMGLVILDCSDGIERSAYLQVVAGTYWSGNTDLSLYSSAMTSKGCWQFANLFSRDIICVPDFLYSFWGLQRDVEGPSSSSCEVLEWRELFRLISTPPPYNLACVEPIQSWGLHVVPTVRGRTPQRMTLHILTYGSIHCPGSRKKFTHACSE